LVFAGLNLTNMGSARTPRYATAADVILSDDVIADVTAHDVQPGCVYTNDLCVSRPKLARSKIIWVQNWMGSVGGYAETTSNQVADKEGVVEERLDWRSRWHEFE